jgi:hypothetical protein
MQQLSGANRSLRFSLGGCADETSSCFDLSLRARGFYEESKKRALFANLSGTALAIAVVR